MIVILIVVVAVATLLLMVNNEHTPYDSPGDLTIIYLDTGQGDSILIKTPDYKNILIDAGGNLGPESITAYLSSSNITTIDALIITHPHADHLNYSDEVLRDFDVLSIYHSGMGGNSPSYNDFISAAESEGCPIISDAEIDKGDFLLLSDYVTFEILNIDMLAEDENSASIVIKMSYNEIDFLFMGDAPSEVEYSLISDYGDRLDCEILKVGHHGSRYSTSDIFLDTTPPEIGVICVGENDYGHPHYETLDRLYAYDVDVYGTDLDGTIIIITDGLTYKIY